jgi:hypothetical protein
MEKHHLRFEIDVVFWNVNKARRKLDSLQEVVDRCDDNDRAGILSLEVEEQNEILMTKFVLFLTCTNVEKGHQFYRSIKSLIEG